MKLIYFAVFLILKSFVLNGQAYLNRAIDYPAGAFISNGLYQLEDKYAITLWGENYKCGVMLTDFVRDTFMYFPQFTFSNNSGVVTPDGFRLLGKNLFHDSEMKIYRLDLKGRLLDSLTIAIPDTFKYSPYSIVNILEDYYIGYMKFVGETKKMGIIKHLKNADNVLCENYESDGFSKYILDLINTYNNNLLVSYNVLYLGHEGWDAFVMKLDTFGQVIFKSDTLVRTNIIYPWKYIAELSNKEYLVCYHQDMHGVAGWHDYYPYMPTYTWLDSVGKISRQIIPRIRRPAEVVSSGILAGKGDYFFSYGEVTLLDRDDYYGYITKYSNAGDTIWSHLYRHPDFQTGRYSHEINHLIEEENGDLVGTGRIAEPNTAGKIWLLRVNANGCFGEDGCAELTMSAHKEPSKEESKVQLFPNPNDGGFDLTSSKEIRVIKVINSIGGNQEFRPDNGYSKVRLLNAKPGIYFITVYFADGSKEIRKLIKN